MHEFFNPSSVVVVGVSQRPRNLGKEIARNLFEFGFTGQIHFVGSKGGVLFGRRIYTSLVAIPDPVDLAIILTPARTVPDVLEECGRLGIRRAVIESGGFGELDSGGREVGQLLKATAARHGIRFIGPNCIGIMNSTNGLATPFTTMKNVFRKGGVGIIAQSGGVALSLLNMFDGEQIGFSKFASIGNKLNVDENDLLEYYLSDPETQVVCLYLESIREGARLMEIARKASKPIVMFKANIAQYSSGVAQSHTEALSNDDTVTDAALRQAGITRFRDMQSYLDFVKILQLPRIKGRNLAIVSRSGGHAVIAADAAYTYDFHLPPFGTEFLEEIRKHLRADVIRLANPLDLGDLFDFEVYVRIVEHTLQEPDVHAVVFLHTYFATVEGESSRKLLQSIAALSEKYDKPIAVCVSTEQYELSRLHKELDFPIFLSPERAISALDARIQYEGRRESMKTGGALFMPDPTPDLESARRVIAETCANGRVPLFHEAMRIVEACGIPVARFAVVSPGDDAAPFPGPYAVKAAGSALSHKSDQGAVMLDAPDYGAAKLIAADFADRFGTDPSLGFEAVVVQQMAQRTPECYELIVGGLRDPHFGPMIMLSHGGTLVELFANPVFKAAPLTEADIDAMIAELSASAIFQGVRGRRPINIQALKDVIARVGLLMQTFPQVAALDLNPVLVSPEGVLVLDARITPV